MEIGIQRDLTLSSCKVKAYGEINVFQGDTLLLFSMLKGEECTVNKSGSTVKLLHAGVNYAVGGDVIFRQVDNSDSWFGVVPTGSSRKERTYQGSLKIGIEKEGLLLVNLVHLNDYLCGVIQAESGVNQNLEYYKVQAILARTYALKNVDKHRDEGFMLTDLVNCQAYHGRCTHPDVIRKAVEDSNGEVVVDQSLQLITAAYHANSGGQTANPEAVWNKPVPYLRSVIDTFSVGMPGYYWTKTITENEWFGYLSRKFGYPLEDSLAKVKALNWRQPFREAFFVDKKYGIPLRDIRTDFKLKSTFFSVYHVNGQVELRGRGFGHGVGLSQEGAMAMSKKGYTYKQIISFYYQQVMVMDMRTLLFFREVHIEDLAEGGG